MSKPNVKKPYKQSKVKLDKKMSLLAYALTLVCAVAARTIQLQNNMDFSTGKYIDPSIGKNYSFWVILIGFVLIFLILTFGKSRDKAIKSCILVNPMRLNADKLNKKISPKASAAMFLMAFLIIFDIFLELSAVANVNIELSTEDNPVFIFAGIPVLDWFIYVLAIISAITFITIGANIIKGEGISRGNGVFLAFYAVWKLLQIFSMMNNNEIIGVHSEKIYVMLTAMTSAMFFIFAAKFFSGFEKKHTRIWLCMYGYMASIFAAVSTIPRYIIFFTKRYEDRLGMETPDTSDVGIIFATIAIVAVFWGAYEYRNMPKLNLTGKRRWSGSVSFTKGMSSIDE